MKILKHSLGVVAGMVCMLIVYFTAAVIMGFIGNIPIIGRILYFPAGAPWALICTAPLAGVAAGCMAAQKIAGSTKPMAVAAIVFWGLNLFFTVVQTFTWRQFFISIFAIGTAILFFSYGGEEGAKD